MRRLRTEKRLRITLVGGGLTLPENAVIPDGVRADAAYVAALEQAREAV